MSTSSILITTQLDRSLFSDDPVGAVKEFLLAVCSLSEGFNLGVDCPSKACTRYSKHFRTSKSKSKTLTFKHIFYRLGFVSTHKNFTVTTPYVGLYAEWGHSLIITTAYQFSVLFCCLRHLSSFSGI